MTDKNTNFGTENDLCEACGVTAEVGYIIGEGDEVAEVSLFGQTKEALEEELAKYLALAKSVCADFEYEASPITQDSKEIHAKFKFSVSAEKLIFELKSQSISR